MRSRSAALGGVDREATSMHSPHKLQPGGKPTSVHMQLLRIPVVRRSLHTLVPSAFLPAMRLEHLALWTPRLEALRDFYVRHFGCTAGPLYISRSHPFRSYFLTFPGGGARLELMEHPGLEAAPAGSAPDRTGLAHFALSLGEESEVRAATERLRAAGVRVTSEPRRTGDGYYESVVLDPDGNRIELTV
jgi:lactoylglutathione lyase